MGLNDDQWSLAFQSRLGRDKWIEPYTEQLGTIAGGMSRRRPITAVREIQAVAFGGVSLAQVALGQTMVAHQQMIEWLLQMRFGDPYVVDLPWPLRRLLVGIILARYCGMNRISRMPGRAANARMPYSIEGWQ